MRKTVRHNGTERHTSRGGIPGVPSDPVRTSSAALPSFAGTTVYQGGNVLLENHSPTVCGAFRRIDPIEIDPRAQWGAGIVHPIDRKIMSPRAEPLMAGDHSPQSALNVKQSDAHRSTSLQCKGNDASRIQRCCVN